MTCDLSGRDSRAASEPPERLGALQSLQDDLIRPYNFLSHLHNGEQEGPPADAAFPSVRLANVKSVKISFPKDERTHACMRLLPYFTGLCSVQQQRVPTPV